MSKTILVCGYGPGISDAVARRFGAEGYSVALVARSADKLAAAERALASAGVKAAGFPTDLADPTAVQALVESAREKLGPIAVVHWNAYGGGGGDLSAPASELRAPFDVSVVGLVAAVQAALHDLEAQKGAVLVTGGGLAFYDPKVDAMAAQWNAMGLAVAKAAQHKLVGVLGEKLRGQGIYVGEVVVAGMVKGTAFDHGNATLEPSAIAGRFWDLFTARTERSVTIAG